MKKISALILVFYSICSFGQWTENFDSQINNSYGTGTITINGRDWSRKDAGNFSYANTSMGSYAFTINDDKSGAHITTPVLNTCSSVNFQYAYKNGSSSNVFQLQVSTDGITFSTLDTHTLGASSNESYVNYSFNVNNSSSTTYIRILSDNQNAHLFIEDFHYEPITAPCVEPTSDATFHANSPQNISTDSVTLNWTNGDGGNRIVIVSENSPVSFVPTDNTTYTSNANYGSSTSVAANEYIVYNGSASTVAITGLTPGTLYYTTIYEYGCTPGTEDYYTAGSPTTDSFYTKPENPTNFTEICVNDTSIDLSWSAPSSGNFDNYLLVVRENAAPHSVNSIDPASISGESLDYTSASMYGSTTEYTRYLYKGSNTSATITGLTNGTSYTFKLFCYATDGTLFEYSSGTTVTKTIEPQNVISASGSAADTQANINWTNINSSCFDEVLIVANETNGINFTPSGDGSSYVANTTYTSVNQVVYQNTGTNVTVTGLTNGTTYYFEIFIRNGTTWSSGVEIAVTPSNTTIFKPGDLVFVGYDGQYLGSGSGDEYLVATMVDITPGTTFALVNSRYEAGAAAGIRTDKWGGAGSDASANPGVIEISYNGASNINAGSVLVLHLSNALDYVGVITGTTETDQTSNFSTSFPFGSGSAPNISTGGSDQIYLIQGSFSSDGTIDANEANYILNGTLLHGITNRTSWVPLANSCNGDSSGGNTRESRLHPLLNCFNVENSNSNAVSGFYQNNQVHSGTFRDIILGISNSSYWTLGSGRYTSDPSSTANNRAAHTFTITPSGNTSGTWVSSSDTNWFNCANWENLTVPDNTTNVIINQSLLAATEINFNATYADEFNNIAECNDLTITSNSVIIEGNPLDKLEINGNLTINGGELDMDDGDSNTQDGNIYLYGNWTNTSETNFIEGNSTVHFLGNGMQQLVNCNANADTEIFYNLVLDNDFSSDDFGTNIHANNNVTINANRTITVKENDYFLAANILTNNGKVIVENKGSLVQTTPGADNNSGSDYEIKKTTPEYVEYDFTYWSSPINSAVIATVFAANEPSRIFDFTTANFADVSPANTYDDNNDDWNNPTETNMTVGKGYIVMGEGSEWPFVNNGFATNLTQSVSFNGKINNGDITYPVTLDANNTDAFTNENLIGNPYPSAIDGEQFIIDNPNLTGTLYFWTHKTPIAFTGTPDPDDDAFNFTNDDYATFTTAGYAASASGATVPNDKLIASCQAFFAPVTTAGTVTFNNNIRTTGINDNFRTQDRAWFNLTNTNGLFRQILIGFFNDGTDNEDRLYDGKRMFNGTNYDFFSILNNERYAIQGFGPFVEEKIVPIGIHNLENGAFTISIDRTEGILDHKNIYLKDNLLNIYHDLKLADYTFTCNQIGEINNRFEIHFRNSTLNTQNNELTTNTLQVYQTDNSIHLNISNNEIMSKVEVYNTLGQLLLLKDIYTPQYSISNTFNTNLLFIRVKTKNGEIFVKKQWIK